MSKLIKPVPSIEEQEKEQEKLRDILLLLDNLFKRESATAKLVLGNLYDIAIVNLINQNAPLKPLSPLLKLIANTSKPLASMIAVRAFQALCPKLVTDYLYSLVEFKKIESSSSQIQEIKALSSLEIQAQLQEVQVLRKRVKMLTGSLVATLAIFTGSSLFVAHRLGLQPSDLLQPAQTAIDSTHYPQRLPDRVK